MTSPRFEIVRLDDGWFARFVAANGRVVWVTPGLYGRRRNAVAAVAAIGDAPRYSDGKDADLIEVRDIDDRTPPFPEPTIEWPCYLAIGLDDREFWHDRDTHWRHCFEGDCVETVPPIGTNVFVRAGRVVVREVPS